MATLGHPGIDNPLSDAGIGKLALGGPRGWLGKMREVVNNILLGKMNVTLDVTLAPNAASTVVSDPRIGAGSLISLAMPLTANAAAERANGTAIVASRGKQTATITHANNAQTDRNFRLAIIG